jgi:hypothetical protein
MKTVREGKGYKGRMSIMMGFEAKVRQRRK